MTVAAAAKPVVIPVASQAAIDEFCDTLWLEDGLSKKHT